MEHTAFRCLECKIISVFPTRVSDGRRCLECGGYIIPFGHAKVHPQRVSEMAIDVEVNTKQLDKALKKADKLSKAVADLNMEIKILGSK